jgi:hypothetical protein
MKKALKYLGYTAGILTIGFVVLVVLGNYVFTKKFYLSCAGTTKYISEKDGYVKTTSTQQKNESLRISLTKYPWGALHTSINTETDLFASDLHSDFVHVDEQSINAWRRLSSDKSFIFSGVTFNRITRAIEIETKHGGNESHDSENVLFNGVCAEVAPL